MTSAWNVRKERFARRVAIEDDQEHKNNAPDDARGTDRPQGPAEANEGFEGPGVAEQSGKLDRQDTDVVQNTTCHLPENAGLDGEVARPHMGDMLAESMVCPVDVNTAYSKGERLWFSKSGESYSHTRGVRTYDRYESHPIVPPKRRLGQISGVAANTDSHRRQQDPSDACCY